MNNPNITITKAMIDRTNIDARDILDDDGNYMLPPGIVIQKFPPKFTVAYVHGCDTSAVIIYEILEKNTYEVFALNTYDLGARWLSIKNVISTGQLISMHCEIHDKYNDNITGMFTEYKEAEKQAIKLIAIASTIRDPKEREQYLIKEAAYSYTISSND